MPATWATDQKLSVAVDGTTWTKKLKSQILREMARCVFTASIRMDQMALQLLQFAKQIEELRGQVYTTSKKNDDLVSWEAKYKRLKLRFQELGEDEGKEMADAKATPEYLALLAKYEKKRNELIASLSSAPAAYSSSSSVPSAKQYLVPIFKTCFSRLKCDWPSWSKSLRV